MGFLDTNVWNPCISATGITHTLQFGNALPKLESAGDSNDCKTGGSVRLYPRIPFALAMGVCQALYKYKERTPSPAGAPFNKNEKTNIT